MTFEGFKDDQFHVLACFIRKNLAFKYTMYLNDTLYQSQVISTIFEMSQSESLHHFWWEFPPASLQEPRLPFELPQVSPNGWGGGSRPLLENVQKEAAFSSVWLPLVDQRFVINATGLPRLFFLKLAFILFSEIILLFPSSVVVCVFESVNRSLEWIFTIYQYVLLGLLVRRSWATVNPFRSFTNGFVSQGSKNLAKFYLVVYALLSGQKKFRTIFFCPLCQCPCFFVFIIFCPFGPWIVVRVICVHIFVW